MPEKIAVLTGASRGLGRSIALHLAQAGVSIIGTYHSQKNEGDAVAGEIRARGARAVMVSASPPTARPRALSRW
jgi:NAD(P)-dependent dehydrogenase (short-subunit alcohol dehydrogenase family)